MERALYFYTGDVLGMDETTNLWLALILGVTYVVGALSSHKLCKFSNEKERFVGLRPWPNPHPPRLIHRPV